MQKRRLTTIECRAAGALKAAATGAALAAFPIAAWPQSGPVTASFEAIPDPGEEEEGEFGFRQGGFVAAPILFEEPTVGTGLALGAGFLFQSDEDSSTSFLGLGGFRTSNGSSGFALGGSLSFDENRWKLKFLGGAADVFYDLYLFGIPIPLRQEGTIAKIEAAYGFTPDISLGVGFQVLDTTIKLDGPGILPPELVPDANLNLGKVTLTFDWDRRDDSLFPLTGSNVSFDLGFGESIDLGGFDYQKAVVTYDQFLNTRETDVLAFRVAGCAATDDAPFFDACSLGGTDGFRGFPSTRFIGAELASFQIAYRGRLTERFGYEVFAGAGQVFHRFGSADEDSKLQKAAGIGARFRLSKKFPFDYSVDVSRNDESENLLYVYVGQRF